MDELTSFGLGVLIVSGGLAAALYVAKLSARLAIPAAALFLVAAAIASDVFPGLVVGIGTVEQIATVALIVILFQGGSSIGLKRFRIAAGPIASLGVLGTFACAALVALFVHAVFDLGWLTSGLLGAAVAPTDPAVMFSVLGDREIRGRSRTILEGESGANDPVGIALMVGLIELAEHSDASFWIVVRVFLEQMTVGLAVGVAGGLVATYVLRRVELPSSGLYTVRTLAIAGVIYGAAAVAHGSGFLAVFVAGLVVADVDAPFKHDIAVFEEGLATLAEIVVFVGLGLTVDISSITLGRVGEGLAIAAFLALAARPFVVGALLLPARLTNGERLFVMWGGLKGAVPILLAAFAVAAHVTDGRRIYETVFVVVLASVIVQGSTIPLAAQRFGVEAQS
ncbi:MAG TPA: cation:proton antiporter [Gaiellaceae bacterium]|nr:cation:proton antiporter [Gaiellaceae bacterium]